MMGNGEVEVKALDAHHLAGTIGETGQRIRERNRNERNQR